MQNYKKHVFGNKNRIYLYLLDEPMEKGILGLVKSKLFEKHIGIYIDQNAEEMQYCLGGIYISGYQQQPTYLLKNY